MSAVNYDFFSQIAFIAIIASSGIISFMRYKQREKRECIANACKDITIKLDFMNTTITDYLKLKTNDEIKCNTNYETIINERYQITKMEIGQIKDNLLSRLAKTELIKYSREDILAKSHEEVFFKKANNDLIRIEESTSYFCEKLSATDISTCAAADGAIFSVRQGFGTVINEIYYNNVHTRIDFQQFAIEYFPATVSLASILMKLVN